MPKVALVKGLDIYDDYSSSNFIQSITEWTEISDEELSILRRNESQLEGWTVIEQCSNPHEVIFTTVSQALEKIKQAEEKRANYLLEQQRKREEAKAKKEKEKLLKDRITLAKIVQENPDLVKELLK